MSAIALTPSQVFASNLDVRIGNKTAAINLNVAPKGSKVNVDLGYLYREEDINVGTLGLHAVGQTVLANLPATAGLGLELTAFDAGPADGAGVGLGGFLKLNIPAVAGLSVEGAAHYSPSITTFGDSDSIRHFKAQVNYRLIPNADVFTGYHYQNVSIENSPSTSLDASFFIGMSLRF